MAYSQQLTQWKRNLTRCHAPRPAAPPARHGPALAHRLRAAVASRDSVAAAPQLVVPPAAVLVCPGFLADHRGPECTELAASLRAHLTNGTAAAAEQRQQQSNPGTSTLNQHVVEVLPIARSDWYPTLRGSSFKFYVDALAEAIKALTDRTGGRPISLVCLSAAGWIARLALGREPYEGNVYGLSDCVDTLLTLGTPHGSIEAYPFGRVPERRIGEDPSLPPDVQGSSLRLANTVYPDAASIAPTKLVCVCGTTVVGSSATLPQRIADVAAGRVRPRQALDELLAAVSYEATCGSREAEGDGVTPVSTALVPGATAVLLPGCWHAPGPGPRKWYGSPDAVPLWAPYLSAAGPQGAAAWRVGSNGGEGKPAAGDETVASRRR